MWLVCRTTNALSTALLQDALLNGSPNWDITLSDVLAILLQSALACRPGDMKMTDGYKQKEDLQLKDVDLRVTETSEEPAIKMTVTLRFCKGFKCVLALSPENTVSRSCLRVVGYSISLPIDSKGLDNVR